MYKAEYSKYFGRDYAKTTQKNLGFREQVDKKIQQVLAYPAVYKNLKKPLQGYRRVHVGPFVITFKIDGKFVKFVRLAHHDEVYKLPHD